MGELIVIDTGRCPSQFFQERASEDESVVYRWFDVDAGAISIGVKRNIACFLARGQVIAHFDDDDLYAPEYLDFMIAQMISAAGSDGRQTSTDLMRGLA